MGDPILLNARFLNVLVFMEPPTVRLHHRQYPDCTRHHALCRTDAHWRRGADSHLPEQLVQPSMTEALRGQRSNSVPAQNQKTAQEGNA